MKKNLKHISALIVLLTLSGSIWAQAGKNLVTYTIDGGAFHHQQITIHADPKGVENGAMSGPTVGYTKINLDDAAPGDRTTGPKWDLDIAFSQVGTGTAKVGEPLTGSHNHVDRQVYFRLQVQSEGKNKYLGADHNDPSKTPGTIRITKFGSVGGTIEGDFEGTVKGSDGLYTITGGHFVATRKL
ncbi:hypothetical protein [Mucilaginibacter lappiensis]|uniref:Uncharacterized protein n=1 Tax=Mucilaginibacter lappiensis TaxID=354630 RepID=A0A841JEI8_9SPHI|nr:hypothetical protein [Mucilaginibacter lappiensis]MBB6111980.1 hypothetical protein [Mucilaginibacter lappiensis]MBB6126501.1 hypothetical protein [Mucilaginibacter lappiensis]